jgi:putative inorganic carbon (hco3(-)) transporter
VLYALCLLYVALIYVRPGELLPQLAGVPILAATSTAAAIFAVVSLVLRPRRFADLPNDRCFLAFLGVSVLSVAVSGWLGGAYAAAVRFLPLAFFYLLIRVAVESERQLKWLIALVVALTLFQAASGILQHLTGVGLGNSTAYVERNDEADVDLLDGPADATVSRVRGTGIFGDPNDLAMSLVVVCPFMFSMVLAGDTGLTRRLLAAAGLAVVLYALLLTQSRGGLLGLAVLGAAYAWRRFGRVPAVLVGLVFAVAMLAAGSNRLQEINTSEDSARGRIEAWAAGFDMLRAKPLLGIGAGAFTDHHELVAHNSFVHTAAETGLVGAYCFVGMLYWFLAGNGARRNVAGAAASTLALDVWASGIGLIVCTFFLSRQYSPVFYVPLVIGAVRMSVGRTTGDDAPDWRAWWDWVLVGMMTLGILTLIYLLVRVSS